MSYDQLHLSLEVFTVDAERGIEHHTKDSHEANACNGTIVSVHINELARLFNTKWRARSVPQKGIVESMRMRQGRQDYRRVFLIVIE